MNIPGTESQAALAIDVQSLGDLKRAAKNSSPAALKEAAQQFEALFIQMMLKSMRQATPQDGLLDGGSDGQIYTAMLDQQLSQVMSQKGMGLADMMLQQLKTTGIGASSTAASSGPQAQNTPDNSGTQQAPSGTTLVDEFKNKMRGPAHAAARITGLPVEFILGQAALESGWGKREIVSAQGQNSFNLFGIKADAQWKGDRVETTTTEYVNGTARKTQASFRAYDSYEQAFEDYARLLTRSKRYEGVLANGQTLAGFAQSLQAAGYATDPAYAQKLTRIIQKNLLS